MSRQLLTPQQNPQNVVLGSSSTQSVAFGTKTNVIRLCATSACWVLVGANPTAVKDGASIYVPANFPIWLGVSPGQKLAAIEDSAAGNLSIVEGFQQ